MTQEYIMATITRVQHVQYDTVTLLAVEGKGTDEFNSGNAPIHIKHIGAVFSGDLRVTKSTNADGYFFLRTGRGGDRRRMFFKASARVRLGNDVLTVEEYYNLLALAERLTA